MITLQNVYDSSSKVERELPLHVESTSDGQVRSQVRPNPQLFHNLSDRLILSDKEPDNPTDGDEVPKVPVLTASQAMDLVMMYTTYGNAQSPDYAPTRDWLLALKQKLEGFDATS